MPRKEAVTLEVPPSHNWRTTDQDEINRRRLRAESESFRIFNTSPEHPIFSNFKVCSGSGMRYQVEVRDISNRQFACECVDFSINGLGTCKHVEAVLLHLQGRYKRLFQTASGNPSPRLDVVPELAGALRLTGFDGAVPSRLRKWFGPDGSHRNGAPQETLTALEELKATAMPELRLSQELRGWLENQRRVEERKQLRHQYEQKVQSGQWPPQETKVPLFPYQREGMLHLAFTERSLLADEMGLGKTIQAIAACALLHRLGRATRALVVTPASLKTEWEDQIQRFTDLKYQLVFGGRSARLKAYGRAGAAQAVTAQPVDGPPGGIFFTIVNYEQMLADALEVNGRLRPDIVVLDEAQRIKNWSTKTTQAIKRLQSRYAFVLTGTPIENRIDELYSLMGFLDPSALGPLFRFNREFYELDDRGRPVAYRNLEKLHERIKPYMLRRRKSDVETELPERTDRTFFVPLSAAQQGEYDEHEGVVARLAQAAKRRPLTQQEQDKLMRHMAMMRMVCDTNYILNQDDRICPKLTELEKILEECRDNPEVKVIIFSEWERMLELVRDLCRKLSLGFAWHTGSVPQQRRRAEINLFKSDPRCRIFLSTDSGAAGLNLQNASVVINCDLPWNPAKLEQRIARAWRKHQTRPVTVINLVSEKTIEHRMLETLAQKQALADGVLDHIGNFNSIKLRQGRQAFLERLQQFITPKPEENQAALPAPAALPADRVLGFSNAAHKQVNGALVRCEERYPNEGAHSVLYVVVEREAAQWREELASLHQDYFPPGQSDPLAPVRLEVIDRATDEALNRLAELGLVVPTARATRPLFPLDAAANQKPTLSDSERRQAEEHRQKAGRKIKMAMLLGEGGLTEEARDPLLEAILHLGRALSVENRLPAPADVEQSLLPPLAQAWNAALVPLREFVRDRAATLNPVIQQLQKV